MTYYVNSGNNHQSTHVEPMEATTEFIPFEGKMVRPEIKRHALDLRKETPFHSTQGVRPGNASAAERAEIALNQSDEEYTKLQRAKERQKELDARQESRSRLLSIDLDLPAISDDPKVKALREKLKAAESTAVLNAASSKLEKARTAAEADEELAARKEAALAVGDASEKDRDQADADARKAWERLDTAEAAHAEAKRQAARSDRVSEILRTQLKEVTEEAEARRQEQGRAVMIDAIEEAKEAVADAVEKNERLYKLTRALNKDGVKFVTSPYMPELLTIEVYANRTAYANWLDRIARYFPTNSNGEDQ